MNKEKNVVEFYVLCNRLKNVIRSGWKEWKVNKERVESVAEHIYGVQMLALAMYSEYKYNIDIRKVIYMLAIHELGEIVIGDITPFEISSNDKKLIEHQAIHNLLKNLLSGKEIEDLFLEFDSRITDEAKFAYQCDRLECDLQCKLYDEDKCVDLSNQEDNPIYHDSKVYKLLSEGNSWSSMWLKYWQNKNIYDENFMSVSNYAIDNNISEE